MGGGVLLAAISGWIPAGDIATTFCPAIVGLAVAACVLLYNGPLKQTLLAPATMGVCRALCFLLGAAPLVIVNAGNLVDITHWFPGHILGAAVGMGVYIMGLTAISRSETLGGHFAEIVGGVAIIFLGAVCLALAPKFAPAGTTWVVALNDRFPLLIGLIVFSVLFRGVRVAIRPEPVAIQNLIRVGVMTLIPLSAAFAMLTSGPRVGLAIFGLIIPAIICARRFRVT
jgi:4-hydroxybenzoate polyprenyltransferase